MRPPFRPALPPRLGPCLAAHRPPRGAQRTQAGVLEAPVGDVTIVFANAVGVNTLLAWDTAETKAALALLESVACSRLAALGGYLVEAADGLVLAAFAEPAAAVRWGLSVVSRLMAADWSAKLLTHELCEEVGIDTGPAKAEVSVVTGRVSYRGRVMNRAARIASKASAGQVWCSDVVWRAARRETSLGLAAAASKGPEPDQPRERALTGEASQQANGGLQRTRSLRPCLTQPRGAGGEGSEAGGEGDPEEEAEALEAGLPLAARYQGRHALKGVSEPMDLWWCR
ncbi:hypothetical protein GPECTOR_2g1197 [Gonium pectorale]|uniref:Guanylate cyclase domain-containing protein n=1 Tax=Gonium pectorale TaxID=33097 RepID=A0A150H0F2_GONPE|nr:hypothetical protein GPECTOR_2g1197 [Gonium pectorale]|eukprot:KXZ55647.1 hypothetical protein GPECTOR_2g1197 [Gonium pectorale]